MPKAHSAVSLSQQSAGTYRVSSFDDSFAPKSSVTIKLIIIFNLSQLNFSCLHQFKPQQRRRRRAAMIKSHQINSFTEIWQILCSPFPSSLFPLSLHRRIRCLEKHHRTMGTCSWKWYKNRKGKKLGSALMLMMMCLSCRSILKITIICLSSLHLQHYRDVYSLFKCEPNRKKTGEMKMKNYTYFSLYFIADDCWARHQQTFSLARRSIGPEMNMMATNCLFSFLCSCVKCFHKPATRSAK